MSRVNQGRVEQGREGRGVEEEVLLLAARVITFYPGLDLVHLALELEDYKRESGHIATAAVQLSSGSTRGERAAGRADISHPLMQTPHPPASAFDASIFIAITALGTGSKEAGDERSAWHFQFRRAGSSCMWKDYQNTLGPFATFPLIPSTH